MRMKLFFSDLMFPVGSTHKSDIYCWKQPKTYCTFKSKCSFFTTFQNQSGGCYFKKDFSRFPFSFEARTWTLGGLPNKVKARARRSVVYNFVAQHWNAAKSKYILPMIISCGKYEFHLQTKRHWQPVVLWHWNSYCDVIGRIQWFKTTRDTIW